MYTCMEYTLYDTIYSDERTLQMHVHPPKKKKKTNKQKQTNKQKTSPVPTCKITFDLSWYMCSSKPLKISSCIKKLHNVTGEHELSRYTGRDVFGLSCPW